MKTRLSLSVDKELIDIFVERYPQGSVSIFLEMMLRKELGLVKTYNEKEERLNLLVRSHGRV